MEPRFFIEVPTENMRGKYHDLAGRHMRSLRSPLSDAGISSSLVTARQHGSEPSPALRGTCGLYPPVLVLYENP